MCVHFLLVSNGTRSKIILFCFDIVTLRIWFMMVIFRGNKRNRKHQRVHWNGDADEASTVAEKLLEQWSSYTPIQYDHSVIGFVYIAAYIHTTKIYGCRWMGSGEIGKREKSHLGIRFSLSTWGAQCSPFAMAGHKFKPCSMALHILVNKWAAHSCTTHTHTHTNDDIMN